MIQFNVTPARKPHEPVAAENLRSRTARWWTCSEEKLAQFADMAFAVEANIVTGVFRIRGWRRSPDTGKVELDLIDLPPGHPALGWIGHSAPVPWEPGQRQPFKYVSRRGLLPASPTSGTSSQYLIATMATTVIRQLNQLSSDMSPEFRVMYAIQEFGIIYRLMTTGSPIQNGPKLIDPILPALPDKDIQAVVLDHARLRNTVAHGHSVPEEIATRCVRNTTQALRRIAIETLTAQIEPSRA